MSEKAKLLRPFLCPSGGEGLKTGDIVDGGQSFMSYKNSEAWTFDHPHKLGTKIILFRNEFQLLLNKPCQINQP